MITDYLLLVTLMSVIFVLLQYLYRVRKTITRPNNYLNIIIQNQMIIFISQYLIYYLINHGSIHNYMKQNKHNINE